MAIYITIGPVRGRCLHAHRTLHGAWTCVTRDARTCAAQGGHSDRAIRRIIQGYAVRLNDEEYRQIAAWDQQGR